MVELRQFARTPIDVGVDVALKDGSETFRARARDISVAGMFIHCDRRLDFRTELAVTIILPGEEKERVFPGVVRWSNSEGFGVQFGLLGALDTHAITELQVRIEEGET